MLVVSETYQSYENDALSHRRGSTNQGGGIHGGAHRAEHGTISG
jgi:hypothetical protein